MFIKCLTPILYFAPAGEGDPPPTRGTDTPPAGDPPPAGGADTPPAGDPPPAGGSDTPPAGGDPKWWEDKRIGDHRTMLDAKGLTVDDPIDAVVKLADMEKAAAAKLGKPADEFLDKPGKDQDVAEWLRSNGDLFGIPESADKYDVKKPDTWPKDAKWDTDLESQARDVAHKHGLSGDALNDLVGLFAQKVSAISGQADDDYKDANAKMMEDLTRDFGDKTNEVLTKARQAASVVAGEAGVDEAGLMTMASLFNDKIGDASTIRIFAKIAEKMGDDVFVPGNPSGGIATTPAQARQELAALRAPDGDYAKAVANKDRAEIQRLRPKIERLEKIASPG